MKALGGPEVGPTKRECLHEEGLCLLRVKCIGNVPAWLSGKAFTYRLKIFTSRGTCEWANICGLGSFLGPADIITSTGISDSRRLAQAARHVQNFTAKQLSYDSDSLRAMMGILQEDFDSSKTWIPSWVANHLPPLRRPGHAANILCSLTHVLGTLE